MCAALPAGIAVYNSFLKAVRLRRLMLWGSFLGCGLGLTPLLLVEGVNRRLGISDKAFALVDSALLSSIGQVSGWGGEGGGGGSRAEGRPMRGFGVGGRWALLLWRVRSVLMKRYTCWTLVEL